MTPEKLEERAYAQQYKYIKRRFGTGCADQANYGWSVDGDEETIVVSTKVYGEGVLTTTVVLTTGAITHEFEP